jgi:hypothetical protein
MLNEIAQAVSDNLVAILTVADCTLITGLCLLFRRDRKAEHCN